jgi:hypothetical protein
MPWAPPVWVQPQIGVLVRVLVQVQPQIGVLVRVQPQSGVQVQVQVQVQLEPARPRSQPRGADRHRRTTP